MIIIFCFSSRTAEDSTKDSMGIGYALSSVFVPDFNELSEDEKYAIAASIDHPVRKMAHAVEYTILGILLSGGFYTYKRTRSNILYPFFSSVIYACTDEFHQLFEIGRASCRKRV